MSKSKSASAPSQKRKCFFCDGTGHLCNVCGESEAVCQCDVLDFYDCNACGGVGIAKADQAPTITISVTKVERSLKLKAVHWKGRCYEIACRMHAAKLVKGEPRYGHWTGPVHPKSMFATCSNQLKFCRHGWILMPDGKICDPTRWVFEHVEPYIYVGAMDYYDAGGNRLREQLLKPPPKHDPKALKKFKLKNISQEVFDHICGLLGCVGDTLSLDQVFWLANLPLPRLQPFAREVYTWIASIERSGYVPIDNRQLVFGDER